VIGQAPTDHPPAEGIDHHRQVGEFLVQPDIGEILSANSADG
jgi:hypothetical protein